MSEVRHIIRDGVVIATKVFYPTGGGPNDRGLSRKHLLAAIDRSLRRLNMDYVDLYIVTAGILTRRSKRRSARSMTS